MRGFKQFLFHEARHLHLSEPVTLRITQPVNGQFQTKTVEVTGFDMKFEFYTTAMKLMGAKWIQVLPSHVATKPGMVLISEGYYTTPGGDFYLAEIDPRLLQQALSQKKAFVDTKARTLVESMGDPSVVIECDVNPLDQFHIPSARVVDKEHGVSAVRDGWEKKSVFDWWDFVECIGADGGYAKRSCHLNTDEISDRLKEKRVA